LPAPWPAFSDAERLFCDRKVARGHAAQTRGSARPRLQKFRSLWPVQYGMVWMMRSGQPVDFTPNLTHESEVPLYRQLYEHIALRIRSGELARGERLPATRELAGLLGLNRTTVSAAYEVLETEGLIAGHVGRGSFVTGHTAP